MTDEPRKPHPLSGLARRRNMLQQSADDQYDEEITRFLCGRMFGSWAIKKLMDDAEEKTGERQLSLSAFCRVLDPNAYLESLVIREVDKQVKVSKLLSKFGETKLVTKWLELYAERPHSMRGRPFGLIVRWPFLPPGIILHNSSPDDESEGSYLMWRQGHLTLTLEAVTQWAETYKRNHA